MSGTQIPYCDAEPAPYPSRYRDMLARIEKEARANMDLVRRNKQPLLAASGASTAILLAVLLLAPALLREGDVARPCVQNATFRTCAR